MGKSKQYYIKMLVSTASLICARNLSLGNVRLLCTSSIPPIPRGMLNLKQAKEHQRNGSILIDVREPVELRAHGVVPGAINIPVGYINEGCRSFQPRTFQPHYSTPDFSSMNSSAMKIPGL